jgi:hypothetical protein
MATITIEDGMLNVHLRLWDRILAVHGSLHVPLTHVKSASAGACPPVPWFSKLVGTDFPGVVAAGTFFDKSGWMFYDYGAGHECLFLELEHEFYKRAAIEIDPPQTAGSAAAQISAALAAAAAPAP